jgi:hypothetical protein
MESTKFFFWIVQLLRGHEESFIWEFSSPHQNQNHYESSRMSSEKVFSLMQSLIFDLINNGYLLYSCSACFFDIRLSFLP